MPVFYYLSEGEAADVYQYLKVYPPYQWATLDWVDPRPQQDRPAVEVEPSQKASMVSEPEPAKSHRPGEIADMRIVTSVVAGVFVTMLLMGGFAFTAYELMRLSAVTEGPSLAARNLGVKDEGADAANGQGERRIA